MKTTKGNIYARFSIGRSIIPLHINYIFKLINSLDLILLILLRNIFSQPKYLIDFIPDTTSVVKDILLSFNLNNIA